jgi:hypothetical protein
LVKSYKEFDLRHFYIKLRASFLNKSEVTNEMTNVCSEAMTRGLYLILNFDECAVKYDELFDPDIKEFYGKYLMSPFMWTPNLFTHPKCWQSHLNTKNTELKLDRNFRFLVYSKFIIEPDLLEHDLINEIEKRFEKCFSLLHVNVIIISNFDFNA